MDQDSEAAAQLEKIKNSCTGEKCEIDPKTLFTDEECPGIFSTKKPEIKKYYLKIGKHDYMDTGRTTWLTYSCDGDAVTDESSFEDHRPGGNKIGWRLYIM